MRTIVKIVFLFCLLFFIGRMPDKENGSSFKIKELGIPIKINENAWVDSIFNTLTLQQRIAQLFMIDVYSNQNTYYEQGLIKSIEALQPGGVVFMEGYPTRQLALSNQLQSISKVPLLVGIDGENGLAMRLDSLIAFPKTMAVGAVQKDQLVFDMGVAIGQQCNEMGIHVNFAPVLDISSNPNNPIINYRSFGQDKRNVARKALAYVTGLQSRQVIAVGKHFPGHGNTQTDSHSTLPVLLHESSRLYDIELYPFKNLIDNEIIGIMSGHIAVPSLDSALYRPASLSPNIVQKLLKNEMGFQGLVFTDALNMRGVTRDNLPGEIEVKALLAGNDVLLFPSDLRLAISAIEQAIKRGLLSEELINDKCRRVLKAKHWAGLSEHKQYTTRNLVRRLNNDSLKKTAIELAEACQTLVENQSGIPIHKLDTKNILAIAFGTKNASSFFQQLNQYAHVDTLTIPDVSKMNEAYLNTQLAACNLVIVGQMGLNESPKSRFGLSLAEIYLLEKLADAKPVILSWFGNPYGLKYLSNLEKFQSVLVSYNSDTLSQQLAAQAIFGGVAVNGILPVSINSLFEVGNNPVQEKQERLNFTWAQKIGLNDTAFRTIDSLAQFAIDTGSTPGCQIIYVKNGSVIYNKCFGYFTGQQKQKVESTSIYDLASLTKIAATTLAYMKFYDEHKFEPSTKLSAYWPGLKGTDKKNIRIDQILAHHAGLKSWIPFYKNSLDSLGKLDPRYYKMIPNDTFSIQVANNLYLNKNYIDTLFQCIADTPLYHKNRYRYSDLGFYWLGKLVPDICGDSLDAFVSKNYYQKLGMTRTGFNPLKHFAVNQIVPSADDKIYRKQVIQGFVHDQGAAMLGGVSGHAGLFSTAGDMAILGQMLLNKGVYGGESYFSENTFDVFNKQYFKRRHNRRALGFDKPALKSNEPGPTCLSASQASFGHSGFTGTFLWVDPENQSVYVFLSNRTYPEDENKLLLELNIRTEIQQAFYDVFQH
jgi:beta-glucosidase-like glycosyl hydrolase/CubicO group peptidase (beta-lactamase class C family)